MKKIVLNNNQKETLKKMTKNIGEVVGYGALVAVAALGTASDIEAKNNVNYSDAIDKIMNGDMFSSDKAAIVKVLPENQEHEFYKSIISVVESNMMNSTKKSVIRDLCEKHSISEEES